MRSSLEDQEQVNKCDSNEIQFFFGDVIHHLQRYGVQKMVGVGLLSNMCIHVISEHSSSPYYNNLPPNHPRGCIHAWASLSSTLRYSPRTSW